MFARQVARLRRKEWTGQVKELAEELYAMFQEDVPLFHRGPITLEKNGDQPYFFLNDFETGDIIMRLESGGRTIGDIKVDGNNVVFDDGSGDTTVVSGGGGGDGTSAATAEPFIGQVVSGSGNNYSVKIYPDGLSGDTQNVTVRQLQTSGVNDLDIDPDTWVTVIKTRNDEYYMHSVLPRTQSFAGKITGGSGSSYTVQIYPKGTTGTPKTVSVKQLQIDSSAQIPADTWAIVTQDAKGGYSMQVPVWLEIP